MYVERVPNRNSPPAILLRECYRDGGKTRKRTLANLSDWPEENIEALRRMLRGDAVAPSGAPIMRRSLPHGHGAAVLDTLRQLGLDRLLSNGDRQHKHEVRLCLAMIVARLIAPASKLPTRRLLDEATPTCSLGQVLGLERVDEQQLDAALDWLLEQRERIEAQLGAHIGSAARFSASRRSSAAVADEGVEGVLNVQTSACHAEPQAAGYSRSWRDSSDRTGLTQGRPSQNSHQ